MRVAKVRERMTVSKQCTYFIWRRAVFKKLNEVEGKEWYWVET
jgi:hypothetical protein